MQNEDADYSPRLHVTTRDLEELQEAETALGWDIQYNPLTAEPKQHALKSLALPGLVLLREDHESGVLIRASSPTSFVPFHIPVLCSDRDRINTLPFTSGDLLVPGNASELTVVTPGGSSGYGIHLDDMAYRQLADLAGAEALQDLHRTGLPRLRSAPQQRNALQSLLSTVLEEDPEPVVSNANAREALAASLLEHLAAVIVDAAAAELQRQKHRSSSGVRHARQTLDYLEDNLDRPVSLAELCGVTGTNARSLNYAFRNHFDISPLAYHKNLRLGAVRRALKRLTPDEKTVTEVAFDHGFWHLGRFSRAYKQQFGELPSETLTRRPPPGRSEDLRWLQWRRAGRVRQ